MSTEVLTLAPDAAEWEQILNDELFTTVAGALQVSARTGNRWHLVLTYTNLLDSRRKTMSAHAMQLNGRLNRLQVNMSTLGYVRTGLGGGTPLLVGAHTAGARSLSIDGASNNITNWLAKDDRISIGNQLCYIASNINTNGSGAATIPIWPELWKNYADNTAVDISTPFGVFFLREPITLSLSAAVGDWLTEALVLNLETDVLA